MAADVAPTPEAEPASKAPLQAASPNDGAGAKLEETPDLRALALLSRNPTMLCEKDLLRLKPWWTPVDESLWAKLQDQVADLRVLARQPLDPMHRQILAECFLRLDMARWCIESRPSANGNGSPLPSTNGPNPSSEDHSRRLLRRPLLWASQWLARRWPPFTENNTLFWKLVHRNDEDMLLLVPHEELVVRAVDVREEFERNIKDRHAVTRWLSGGPEKTVPGLLQKLVDDLLVESEQDRHSHGPRLDHMRYKLREALHVVNDHTDRSFRQLATNVLIRSWSGMLLLLLLPVLVLAWGGLGPAGGESPPFVALLMAWGATGAVVANLISHKPFPVALGPTRRYFILYLLVRPTLGAFAALFLYLLVEAKLLGLGMDGSMVNGYGFAALAGAAGFSAEKFLGPIMDRNLRRLLHTADKREETPRLPGSSGGVREEDAA